MSKRNRRPNKGTPGSRAAEKMARAAEAARREDERREAAEFPAREAAAVRQVLANLAGLPVARWRAPYVPAVSNWAEQWSASQGCWSNAQLEARGNSEDLDWIAHMNGYLDHEDLPSVVRVQPDGFYDEVRYGMTGVGEGVLHALAADGARFARQHGRAITAEDAPPSFEPLAQRVLRRANALADWIDPALCAAYVATGYLITEDTQAFYTDAEVDAWSTEVRRFRETYAAAYGMSFSPDLPYADDPALQPITVLHPVLAVEFAARVEEALTQTSNPAVTVH